MKLARIQRLLRLIAALQSGRKPSAETLAEELRVSRRTVFRDLKLLEAAGIPCAFDPQTKGYGLMGGLLLRPITLTMSEAMALLVLTRKFLPRAPVPDRESATRAALKIEGLLPAAVQQEVGPLLEGLSVREGPRPSAACDVDAFGRIQTAIMQRHKLQAVYDSLFEGRAIETTLHPYRLVFINRSWYVIAFSELDREPRTFKLERFKSCRLLPDYFAEPASFDLDTYFGNAWQMIPRDRDYSVRIRFLAKVARNVREVCWHKTQKVRMQADGSLLFEVTVTGLDEISWWILGYGDQAVVEEPPELRDLIRSRAERMLQHYSSAVPSGSR
jgi:proteasome accessory factor B